MHKRKSKLFLGRIPVPLIVILIAAAFFRFYKLYDWLFFGMDQEYNALIARNIIRGIHFPLIGVGVSDTGVYLGPLFSYFSAIPLVLTKGDPLSWAILASVIGVIICALIYAVASKMFSRNVGFLAALFYGVSFLASYYDRQFWNPTFVPLISLFLGYKIFTLLKRDESSLIWIALLMGLATHMHFSLMLFIPLVLLAWWKVRHSVSKKILVYAVITLFVLLSPQILFDFRHGFTNIKAAVRTLTGSNISATPSTLQSRSTEFLSTLGRFVWVPAASDLYLESGQCTTLTSLRKNAYPEGIIIAVAGIIIFFIQMRDKKKTHSPFWVHTNHTYFSYTVVVGIMLISLFYVIFYSRQSFEYYFLYLFPWLSIILAVSCHYLWRHQHIKVVLFPLLVFFVSANLLTIMTSYSYFPYRDKIDALTFAKSYVTPLSYNIDALGECARFGGYRYLFEQMVGTPSSSYMDVYFNWLYKDNGLKPQASRIVMLSMIDHRDSKDTITKWQQIKLGYLTDFPLIKREKFGNIEVFILSARPAVKRVL